jgi:hypothetical protein
MVTSLILKKVSLELSELSHHIRTQSFRNALVSSIPEERLGKMPKLSFLNAVKNV